MIPTCVFALILAHVPSFITIFDHLPTNTYLNHNETLVSNSDSD